MHVTKSLASAVLSIVAIASSAPAAVIVNYDLTGTPSTAVVTVPVTTVATGLASATPLSRGAGITATNLANGFSSTAWPNTAAGSLATAQTGNTYFEWAFTLDATHQASIASFDANLRRSAIVAVNHFALLASFDNFANSFTADTFNYFGRSSGTAPGSVTPFAWMTADVAGQDGNPIATQDLSAVTQLQNIPAGSTVTFRLYAWGDGGGASTNTVAFGRNNGPMLSGSITAVPEPTTLSLLATSATLLSLRRRK